jgi:hypothetical protein
VLHQVHVRGDCACGPYCGHVGPARWRQRGRGRRHPHLPLQAARGHSFLLSDTCVVPLPHPMSMSILCLCLCLRSSSFLLPALWVPPDLVALAVGDLVSKPIGPRSSAWSEPCMIDAVAEEVGSLRDLQHGQLCCVPMFQCICMCWLVGGGLWMGFGCNKECPPMHISCCGKREA